MLSPALGSDTGETMMTSQIKPKAVPTLCAFTVRDNKMGPLML
jgi:hypothetical protein